VTGPARDSLSSLPEAVAAALRQFAAELPATIGAPPLQLRLFGSFSRGEEGPDSDVDIFVLLPVADWAARRRVLDLAADVGLARDVRLSPLIFDEATFHRWREQERALVMDIDREGVPI
jgi:predicted nucleotidyltransferase